MEKNVLSRRDRAISRINGLFGEEVATSLNVSESFDSVFCNVESDLNISYGELEDGRFKICLLSPLSGIDYVFLDDSFKLESIDYVDNETSILFKSKSNYEKKACKSVKINRDRDCGSTIAEDITSYAFGYTCTTTKDGITSSVVSHDYPKYSILDNGFLSFTTINCFNGSNESALLEIYKYKDRYKLKYIDASGEIHDEEIITENEGRIEGNEAKGLADHVDLMFRDPNSDIFMSRIKEELYRFGDESIFFEENCFNLKNYVSGYTEEMGKKSSAFAHISKAYQKKIGFFKAGNN